MSKIDKNIPNVLISLKTKYMFLLAILGFLTAGLGSAAISNTFSNTAEVSIEITNGITYSLGPDIENSSGSETFIQPMSSGGKITLELSKKNLANDDSQPSVETIILDMEGTDLSWRKMEKISSFRYWNQTGRNYSLDIDARGNPGLLEQHIANYNGSNQSLEYNKTVSSTENREFGVGNVDVDGDSKDEILICIAGSEGHRYVPGERWKGDLTIDTKSSSPTGKLKAKASIMGLYDPETGAHPETVRKCPQYS